LPCCKARPTRAGHTGSAMEARHDVVDSGSLDGYERALCIKAHRPADGDETQLALDVGEMVYVQEKDHTGWWGGRKESEDRSGWFPGSCVTILPSEATVKPSGLTEPADVDDKVSVASHETLRTQNRSPVRRSSFVASPQRSLQMMPEASSTRSQISTGMSPQRGSQMMMPSFTRSQLTSVTGVEDELSRLRQDTIDMKKEFGQWMRQSDAHRDKLARELSTERTKRQRLEERLSRAWAGTSSWRSGGESDVSGISVESDQEPQAASSAPQPPPPQQPPRGKEDSPVAAPIVPGIVGLPTPRPADMEPSLGTVASKVSLFNHISNPKQQRSVTDEALSPYRGSCAPERCSRNPRRFFTEGSLSHLKDSAVVEMASTTNAPVYWKSIVMKPHRPFCDADGNQLTLNVNDTVYVHEKDQTGWWGGCKEGCGEQPGWFPASCVRILSAESPKVLTVFAEESSAPHEEAPAPKKSGWKVVREVFNNSADEATHDDRDAENEHEEHHLELSRLKRIQDTVRRWRDSDGDHKAFKSQELEHTATLGDKLFRAIVDMQNHCHKLKQDRCSSDDFTLSHEEPLFAAPPAPAPATAAPAAPPQAVQRSPRPQYPPEEGGSSAGSGGALTPRPRWEEPQRGLVAAKVSLWKNMESQKQPETRSDRSGRALWGPARSTFSSEPPQPPMYSAPVRASAPSMPLLAHPRLRPLCLNTGDDAGGPEVGINFGLSPIYKSRPSNNQLKKFSFVE